MNDERPAALLTHVKAPPRRSMPDSNRWPARASADLPPLLATSRSDWWPSCCFARGLHHAIHDKRRASPGCRVITAANGPDFSWAPWAGARRSTRRSRKLPAPPRGDTFAAPTVLLVLRYACTLLSVVKGTRRSAAAGPPCFCKKKTSVASSQQQAPGNCQHPLAPQQASIMAVCFMPAFVRGTCTLALAGCGSVGCGCWQLLLCHFAPGDLLPDVGSRPSSSSSLTSRLATSRDDGFSGVMHGQSV